MATKPKLKSKPASTTGEAKTPGSKTIMESAQQIWLAGLGAFANAKSEGTKLFETLVSEGMSLEAKTRKIAGGTVDDVRGAVETGANQVRERTQETWDRLEQVFEHRVSRALNKLGVPVRKDLDELMHRVDELNKQIRKVTPAVVKKVGLTQTLSNTVKRARDDFGDLVKDIEEAQLAAKQSMQRSIGKMADRVAPPRNAGSPASASKPAAAHTPGATAKHAPAAKSHATSKSNGAKSAAPKKVPAKTPAKKAATKKAATNKK